MNAASFTTDDVKRRLALLRSERELAIEVGLGADRAYMADLNEEIAACNAAFVGAAVTEIATLRARLWGPLVG